MVGSGHDHGKQKCVHCVGLKTLTQKNTPSYLNKDRRHSTGFSSEETDEVKARRKKDEEIKEKENQTTKVLSKTLEGRGSD